MKGEYAGTYFLPCGTRTSDPATYADAWKAIAQKVIDLFPSLNLQLYSFDPNLSFYRKDINGEVMRGSLFMIPLWLAIALGKVADKVIERA